MLRPLSISALLLFLSSCGTIVNGPTEKIPVTTEPEGATVTTGPVKQQTPATLVLDRDRDYVLTITKAGYQTENIKIVHVISGVEAGNLVVFGTFGFVVDAASGAAWKLEPDHITVTLRPLKPGETINVADRLNKKTLSEKLNELERMKEEHLITDEQYVLIRDITIHCVNC